jgi:hypothetical protein
MPRSNKTTELKKTLVVFGLIIVFILWMASYIYTPLQVIWIQFKDFSYVLSLAFTAFMFIKFLDVEYMVKWAASVMGLKSASSRKTKKQLQTQKEARAILVKNIREAAGQIGEFFLGDMNDDQVLTLIFHDQEFQQGMFRAAELGVGAAQYVANWLKNAKMPQIGFPGADVGRRSH